MCNRVLLLFGKLPHWNVHVNCHVNGTTFQTGLRFQTALSSLRVSCKRALSKGMSNIYSTVTIEKIWPTQNFELSNFLLQLKNRGLGAKVCVAFLLFLFWKEEWCLEVKGSILFVEKTRRNQQWKIQHTVLEGWNFCFSSYKNCEKKVKL